MTFEGLETYLIVVLTGICLFCAHLLLLRQRDPGVDLPLALLFLFQGIATGVAIWADTVDPAGLSGVSRINLIAGGLEIANPFLFWAYVRALTTEGNTQRIPKLHYHLAPIAFVLICFWSLMFLPVDLEAFDPEEDHPEALKIALIALAVVIADVVLAVMIATYVVLVIRRLTAYRTRLRDVFASTENKELTWIWVMILCIGLYVLVHLLYSVTVWAGLFVGEIYVAWLPTLHSAALLSAFWVIGVWGLRQRPGLARVPVHEPREVDPAPTRKYEKSALDDERLQRIARKVDAAMSQDLLYRDPNLSLWDLAKHIGVTSHYVSQALNTHMNQSFFDLVNGWRIKDAIKQLNTTDETILVIAYDVGFNSRSAFYKAFKRETGQTPSDLRN